jgi:anthranilate synthase component 2
MQAINEVFDGKTHESPFPVHGKTCLVHHKGDSIFHGLPSPFRAARYHSLCIEIRSDAVVPLAFVPEGFYMGIRHRFRPIFGVQFHPESFMSEYGIELLRNFLRVRPDWRPVPEAGEEADRFPRANFRPQQLPGEASRLSARRER